MVARYVMFGSYQVLKRRFDSCQTTLEKLSFVGLSTLKFTNETQNSLVTSLYFKIQKIQTTENTVTHMDIFYFNLRQLRIACICAAIYVVDQFDVLKSLFWI